MIKVLDRELRIVGVNGSLRVVDPPSKQWNGHTVRCTCEGCEMQAALAAPACACSSPWRDDEGMCVRCGRRILPLKAA